MFSINCFVLKKFVYVPMLYSFDNNEIKKYILQFSILFKLKYLLYQLAVEKNAFQLTVSLHKRTLKSQLLPQKENGNSTRSRRILHTKQKNSIFKINFCSLALTLT